MILQLRCGKSYYKIVVPRGARVLRTSVGRQVLVLPAARDEDTAVWLPAESIVPAARVGRFGLALRSEHRLSED